MGCADALESIDKIYVMVEEVEKQLGRLAETLKECTGGRGGLYAVYTMLVRMRDELARLRGIVAAECGAGAGEKG